MAILSTDIISTSSLATSASEIFLLGEDTGGTSHNLRNLVGNANTSSTTTSCTFGNDTDGDYLSVGTSGLRAITTAVARPAGSFTTLLVFKSTSAPGATGRLYNLRAGSSTYYEFLENGSGVLYGAQGNGSFGFTAGTAKLTGGSLVAVCLVWDDPSKTATAYFSDGTNISTTIGTAAIYGFTSGYVDILDGWPGKWYLFARWTSALSAANASALATNKGSQLRQASGVSAPTFSGDLSITAAGQDVTLSGTIVSSVTPTATASINDGTTTTGPTSTTITGTGPYTASYTFVGAAPGTYTGTIVATNTGGSLSKSTSTNSTNPTSVAIAAIGGGGTAPSVSAPAPTGLIVTNLTTTSATLGCDAYSGASSYDWQYGTTSGSYGTTVSTSTPTDPLTGLTPATTYYWRVRAVGTSGANPWSAEQSFSTLPAVAPTGLSTTNITTTGATLNCGAVTGAVSYDWRVGSASGVYGAATNTTTIYNVLSSLSSGATYYWQVRAVTAGGVGPWSGEQTFTTVAIVSTSATTSGTSSSNLDLNDLIEEAYERCGLEMRGGYEFRTARRSLNLLTIEWANRGINLWTVEQGSISLTQGTATYDLPGDTIDLIDHVVRTGASQSQVDININRISGSTYATIPNKNATGRPIQVWINRQSGATYPSGVNNPKINVWPTPDRSSYYTFVYWRLRRIQDSGRSGGIVQDIPFRFLPALVAGLAYYLGGKVAGMDQNRLATLKAEYEQQFQLAADEDREKAPNRFVPRLR